MRQVEGEEVRCSKEVADLTSFLDIRGQVRSDLGVQWFVTANRNSSLLET